MGDHYGTDGKSRLRVRYRYISTKKFGNSLQKKSLKGHFPLRLFFEAFIKSQIRFIYFNFKQLNLVNYGIFYNIRREMKSVFLKCKWVGVITKANAIFRILEDSIIRFYCKKVCTYFQR